jgi:hypothetical protein
MSLIGLWRKSALEEQAAKEERAQKGSIGKRIGEQSRHTPRKAGHARVRQITPGIANLPDSVSDQYVHIRQT